MLAYAMTIDTALARGAVTRSPSRSGDHYLVAEEFDVKVHEENLINERAPAEADAPCVSASTI